MLKELWQVLPQLPNLLGEIPGLESQDALWTALASLLRANAPSGGTALPGAIADEIAALSRQLGLEANLLRRMGSTGNIGISLGAEKDSYDLVIAAHMDRPSFRVRDVATGELYAICANRFPEGHYEGAARAMRFDAGRLQVGARGRIISERGASGDSLRFVTEEGKLRWYDTLTLEAEPSLLDDHIIATGLDNCLGVTVALGTAAVLKRLEAKMIQQNRRVLVAFTDQEEGIPEAFFGHGAARLAYAIDPPSLGCLIMDGHSVLPDGPIRMGGGVSHGIISTWSRGSVVPPNAVALALDLSEALNGHRPGTIQANTGYISRSDDMALGRWAQVLGLIGPPLANAHTAEESARLSDVEAGIWWASHYILALLGMAPDLARRYAFPA